MCRMIRSPRLQQTPSQFSLVFLSLCFISALTYSACATIPQEDEAGQYIRVENQNRFQIRAYVAFATSSSVRVLLGTVAPNGYEYFRVPSALRGSRGLVVRCESGHRGEPARAMEYFETAYVTIPRSSTLIVTIRDPMRFSDFAVYSME